MAFAESAQREVTTTVDVIRLDLSREEAETLQAILSYVGGDPDRSPRGHAGSVFNALAPVVGNFLRLKAHGLVVGGITFSNFKESE